MAASRNLLRSLSRGTQLWHSETLSSISSVTLIWSNYIPRRNQEANDSHNQHTTTTVHIPCIIWGGHWGKHAFVPPGRRCVIMYHWNWMQDTQLPNIFTGRGSQARNRKGSSPGRGGFHDDITLEICAALKMSDWLIDKTSLCLYSSAIWARSRSKQHIFHEGVWSGKTHLLDSKSFDPKPHVSLASVSAFRFWEIIFQLSTEAILKVARHPHILCGTKCFQRSEEQKLHQWKSENILCSWFSQLDATF